jgi:hypothetical protein
MLDSIRCVVPCLSFREEGLNNFTGPLIGWPRFVMIQAFPLVATRAGESQIADIIWSGEIPDQISRGTFLKPALRNDVFERRTVAGHPFGGYVER